jgi:hypothetical protein
LVSDKDRARRSNRSGFTNFSELSDLLGQPPAEAILDFFDLPEDYALSRRHDRGTCQLLSSQDGSKVLKGRYICRKPCTGVCLAHWSWSECIIQTPFYNKGFWTLVLHCVMDSDMPNSPSKTSGVIQADKDVDFSQIFSGVRKLANVYGRHPMLLPLQLFMTHYDTTSETFRSIAKEVAEVDSKLLKELEKRSKPDKASQLHRDLSMTLHKCSMDLAELGRRRKFEGELGERLAEDLHNEKKLNLVASMFASMSKSRDIDIESLPGKIESQRNVVSY